LLLCHIPLDGVKSRTSEESNANSLAGIPRRLWHRSRKAGVRGWRDQPFSCSFEDRATVDRKSSPSNFAKRPDSDDSQSMISRKRSCKTASEFDPQNWWTKWSAFWGYSKVRNLNLRKGLGEIAMSHLVPLLEFNLVPPP